MKTPETILPPKTELLAMADKIKNEYQAASPFPHIVIDGFFNSKFLEEVLKEFPDLSTLPSKRFSNPREVKLQGSSEEFFGSNTKSLMHFLNSDTFLKFLQKVTGIEEPLIGDPYFLGGGLHETKRGGFLKVHADFNKHELLKLDRRINVLVYLNKDWLEEWGGNFEIWPPDMSACSKSVPPIFNRMVIFSTCDQSFHGVPDPVKCPDNFSRKSLALYYYSNGRPKAEQIPNKSPHGTIFKARSRNFRDLFATSILDPRKIIRSIVPEAVLIWRRSMKRRLRNE